MSDIKLKPCPFCGSVTNVHLCGANTLGYCFVTCRTCGAQGDSNRLLNRKGETAAKAWNTRCECENKEQVEQMKVCGNCRKYPAANAECVCEHYGECAGCDNEWVNECWQSRNDKPVGL